MPHARAARSEKQERTFLPRVAQETLDFYRAPPRVLGHYGDAAAHPHDAVAAFGEETQRHLFTGRGSGIRGVIGRNFSIGFDLRVRCSLRLLEPADDLDGCLENPRRTPVPLVVRVGHQAVDVRFQVGGELKVRRRVPPGGVDHPPAQNGALRSAQLDVDHPARRIREVPLAVHQVDGGVEALAGGVDAFVGVGEDLFGGVPVVVHGLLGGEGLGGQKEQDDKSERSEAG